MYPAASDQHPDIPGGDIVMKKLVQHFRSHPARTYLALFLFMILPAVVLYPLARSGNPVGMGIFLALVILANIAATFF